MRPRTIQSDQDAAAVSASSNKPRSLLMLRGLLLFVALIFAALGAWQVQRLFWKLDLIARVDARVHAAPVAPPSDADWKSSGGASAFEYRHVTVSGTFDHARQVFVQAVTERGPGFWVVAPLTQDDGSLILINRGFVPADKREAAASGIRSGKVAVTGLLRLSEPGGGFLRTNDPAGDRWYSRDVDAISTAKGISGQKPYFIDADATPNPGGYPIGGLTVVQFRNSHLTYALTWFALAAMAIGVAFWLRRGRALE